MKTNTVRIDVRDDLRNGQEPFSRIMQAVASLGECDELILVAPFEPAPLYSLLGGRGYSHEVKQTSDGDWEVRFHRDRQATTVGQRPSGAGQVREVDTRGLSSPKPLVAILQAVAALPPGAELKARTDRRPLNLYETLIEHGYSGQTEQTEDGSFVTHIRTLRRSQ